MLVLAEGEEFRLVRVSALALGGQDELEYVSLGHDALAPIAAAWDAEVSRQLRFRKRAVLGLLLAGLALTIITLLSYLNLSSAAAETERQLIARTVERNDFAVNALADGVGWRVRRAWRILEQEAADKRLTHIMRRVQGACLPDAAKAALEDWVCQAQRQYSAPLEVSAWVLTNADGCEVANSSRSDTIGHNFAYRDYFRGPRKDLPEAPPQPLRTPYLSAAFFRKGDGKPRIACSVPIWDNAAAAGQHASRPLGVLTVTLSPVQFFKLLQKGTAKQRVVMLLDSRGVLLYHLQRGGAQSEGVLCHSPVTADLQTRLQKIVEEKGARPWDVVDPDGKAGLSGDEEWFGALKTVVIPATPPRESEVTTPWLLIVGEPRSSITQPLRSLRERFFLHGVIATALVHFTLVAVIAVITFRVLPRKMRFLESFLAEE